MMARVAPITASSGNTVRWRLNLFGDWHLNLAIETFVWVRIMVEDSTQTYVISRTQESKTNREVRRTLRRYVMRDLPLAPDSDAVINVRKGQQENPAGSDPLPRRESCTMLIQTFT